MRPPASSRQLAWKYPAALQNIDTVCSKAAALLEQCSLQKKDRFAIELLLREALNNAVIHGCHQNPHLFFSGSLIISDHQAVIEVSDEGLGFEWRSESRSLHPDGDETGRGLQIYANYASSIKFNDAGNCVTLTLSLNAQQTSQGEYDD
jgi:anti-sigma regulatory factor (Ser/Thr protein kinase)